MFESIRITARTLALGAMALALSGCEKAMQDMYNQPKYKPLAVSTLWRDGQSARPGVPGAVAHSAGARSGTSSGRQGVLPLPTAATPTEPVTMQTLARGRERYDIYCSPCHSIAGDGDGMVARRGFPRPPSYHTDKLRDAPDSHFYDVVTNGYGIMYSYADRVEPQDRWAIVAYIRALQLSQNARIDDVPPEHRADLLKATR